MKAKNPSTGNFEEVYVKALDSLPVGSEIDFTGSVSDIPIGWEQVDSYSTSEINTGKTWIDGKPIYRKTIPFTNSSTSWVTVGTISNLSKVVNLYGIALDSSNNSNVIPNNGTEQVSIYVSSAGNVQKISTNWYNNKDAWITVEYTKTTD